MDEAADEPSDFEWRNLKKLAVLVLSSLVWKNKHVQDQIRPLGGIEAVLNCCSYDEHNPYIREHAIMCLRFLMEGNKENQERIHALEKYNQDAKAKAESEGGGMRASAATEERARSHVNVRVPDEVLDQQGYETYMDSKGQVMLRKRQPPAQQQQQHQSLTNRDAGKGKGKIDVSSPAMSSAGMSGAGLSMGGLSSGLAGMAGMRDPKALEELVQQVMRDLPRVQGLRGGEERAVEVEEALKKLDKGFDGGMG
jgi:palmitoyltransferase